MLKLILPYPPSINHYWRRVGVKTLISRPGRIFRQEVLYLLAQRTIDPMLGRLSVDITLHPPDRRRRDIDNCLKSLLDAIEHGGAIGNDEQIDELRICRGHVKQGGQAVVWIRNMEGPANGREAGAEGTAEAKS